MKVIVAYSGGKDSQAALIWAVRESGFDSAIEAVFCDTGWEHEATYKHITETTAALNVPLVTLRSKRYDGMIDLAKKKGRFPSTKARFCTEELKTKPMIDYILSQEDHILVLQGIRAEESPSRALMSKSCTYFRYYFEPYKIDKNGKKRTHSYRKKDIIRRNSDGWATEVFRPCFDWTGGEVMSYIINNGMKPNPLYYQGAKRVGCYPCIMCGLSEIKGIVEHNPDYIERLKSAEKEVERTFFPPGYIPERECRTTDPSTGIKIPSAEDVVRYVSDKNATDDMFAEDNKDRRCMSFYGICE